MAVVLECPRDHRTFLSPAEARARIHAEDDECEQSGQITRKEFDTTRARYENRETETRLTLCLARDDQQTSRSPLRDASQIVSPASRPRISEPVDLVDRRQSLVINLSKRCLVMQCQHGSFPLVTHGTLSSTCVWSTAGGGRESTTQLAVKKSIRPASKCSHLLAYMQETLLPAQGDHTDKLRCWIAS